MSEYGLRTNKVALRSAGRITFGPSSILFLADNASAKIFAVDVADPGDQGGTDPFTMDNVEVRVGSFLGCDAADVTIRDVAVHPVSQNIYLSVQRGHGDDAQPVLIRIGRRDGAISDVRLDGAPASETSIADAPAADDERIDVTLPMGDEGEAIQIPGGRTIRILKRPIRSSTITDMAYADGALLVAGLSNEEFSSKFRRIPFPFNDSQSGSNLEIFHVSHGKWETAAPIRTFVPYAGGEAILASYTCTPLVYFPLAELKPGAKVVGRTVAELGAMNQPLDMVLFRQDGADYLLVANTAHGLLKLACRDIDNQPPLTEPHRPEGAPRKAETIPAVVRLANLNDAHILALQAEGGRHHLRSLEIDAL